MSLRLRLLAILPRLFSLGLRSLGDVFREIPEARTRSSILVLYDDSGNRLAFWLGFENGRPVVREVDPDNPPPATNKVSMHVDTLIKILKGRLDFRAAYLYDLVDVKSYDGMPSAYHFLLWSAFFDRVRRGIGLG